MLVATLTALSEGVSLHHTTTHQIHLDRTFNAGLLLQAIDRTQRLGLPRDANCTATYLMAARRDVSDTIDNIAHRRLDTKVLDMANADRIGRMRRCVDSIAPRRGQRSA